MRSRVQSNENGRKRPHENGGRPSAASASPQKAKKAKGNQLHQSKTKTELEDGGERKRTTSAQEFMLSAFLSGSSSSPIRAPASEAKRQEIKPVRDGALWADKYQPYTQDEMAVHRNKVEEVRNWLKSALDGKRSHRILLCSGPPGCGKTAIIKMLSLELDYDISEWTNGVSSSSFGGLSRESISTRFVDFLYDSDRYPALEFGTTSSKTSTRKIILVEDWPNISESTTRTNVQNAIAEYVHSPNTSPPLVLILSESVLRNEVDLDGSRSSSAGGSIDIRSIIAPQLMSHYAFHRVSFNPIATTFMRKALQDVVAQEYRSLPARFRPDPELINLIASSSSGDIRSALNNLQFIAVKESADGAHPTVASKKGKKDSKQPPRKEVTQLMQSMSARENSLLLFHALGKVLYNKRIGDPDDDSGEQLPAVDQTALPDHLVGFQRRPSKVDVEDLFVSMTMDIPTFILYLHSNYPNFVNNVDELVTISENLSQSDSLGGRYGFKYQSYQYQIAVRGTLMSLPSPVPRRSQKMVKSDWFDMTRKQREWLENVREVQSALQDPENVSMVDLLSATEAVLVTEVIPLLAKTIRPFSSSFVKDSKRGEPSFDQRINPLIRNKLNQATSFQASFGSAFGQVIGEKEVVEEDQEVPEEAQEKYKRAEDGVAATTVAAGGDRQGLAKHTTGRTVVMYDEDDDIED